MIGFLDSNKTRDQVVSEDMMPKIMKAANAGLIPRYNPETGYPHEESAGAGEETGPIGKRFEWRSTNVILNDMQAAEDADDQRLIEFHKKEADERYGKRLQIQPNAERGIWEN